MKHYHVEFSIEVTAEDPAAACKRAWELLTSSDAMLPVGTVTTLESEANEDGDMAGDREDIDLQGLAEETPVNPCDTCSDAGDACRDCRRPGRDGDDLHSEG